MDQVWDPRGEAGTALARVVEGFGQQVLGRADMLEGLLQDDIPQLPRETALLTAAARAGVADLLAERVRQGISPQAAISMAATEMTARTAVDASGAPWAAGVFAQVLGYQVPGTPLIQAPPAQAPPQDAPTTPAPNVPAPPTTPAPAPPEPAFPGRQTVPPASDQRPTVLIPAATGRGLATAAMAAVAIMAPMQLLWCAIASADHVLSDSVIAPSDLWLFAIFLMAGLTATAIWSARGWRGGIGFAAVLGIAVPALATAIFATADATELTSLPGDLRQLLELLSLFWLAATIVAVGLAVAGLRRWHQLRRCKPKGLVAVLAAAGVGYALANILAQGDYFGTPEFNVLGPGVHGWWIVAGIAFVGLTAVPPLLIAYLLPRPGARLAALAGWLLFTLANQMGDSPANGITAKPGLYLTWVLWAVVLAGAAVLAIRRDAGSAGTQSASDGRGSAAVRL